MIPQVGDKAPPLKGTDQDGKSVQLSDFIGKKVALCFYPKDNTPGCTSEVCNLRDNFVALTRAGYILFGISSDSAQSHQNFVQKQQLPFKLIADVDKSIHIQYGTWVEKSMYGRKFMGTARITFIIDEKGIISKVIQKVDTKNHSQQILADALS